jgi:hypothetical protein
MFLTKPASATPLAIYLSALSIVIPGQELSAEPSRWERPDPHRNEAGFFDIHVCNWPGRPLFYMPLLSTTRFEELKKVEVIYPDGHLLGQLNLAEYKSVERKGSPVKRVYIKEFDVPADAEDGWYQLRVTLTNGEVFQASDYVALIALPQATGLKPGENEVVPLPDTLSWNPVKGAAYYQVYVRDLWNDGKIIHTSELLTQPHLKLPGGLLERGGMYSWSVHARDVNEHPVLGDFNHGSISPPTTFEVER